MEETLKKVLAELEMIRKIKMIELIERGYSQSKLGNALGISQATVSRMMAGKPKSGKDKPAKSDGDE
jgi:predicted transcriptional regulator